MAGSTFMSLSGYLMLGLLGFRLMWGFVGGRYARFSSFRFSLREGLTYLLQVLTGSAKRHLGHNPAGSWAVYLLLVLGLLAGLSGMVTLAGQEGQGPLGAVGALLGWRGIQGGARGRGQCRCLVVVVLHLAGVALESWRHRENLPRAMLTGTQGRGARCRHPFASSFQRIVACWWR